MKQIKRLISTVILMLFYCINPQAEELKKDPKISAFFDVVLNGLEQKILVQSNNLDNPILLWLHGGPGTSEMFINHYCMYNLYDSFTVVHWDQRGTALSYKTGLKGSDVSFNKILEDAWQLTELLKLKYKQTKIFIIGHSFGSIIGIHLIEKYPENYYAYVGMGQVIDDAKSREITYNWFVNKLKQANDTVELAKLTKSKRIPRSLIKRYHGIYVGNKTLIEVIKGSPYYYEGYIDTYFASMKFVRHNISKNPATHEKNILKEIQNLKVPVYFFEGKHDRIAACSPELVIEYMKSLQAPSKEIVWFEHSAHHPNIDEPAKFQRMLIDKVLKENYLIN